MEQPLVSVITITRNRGKLIGRCIQSVLNQTYKNIEHIIVDGASDDETDEVVASFKDERLKYIKLDSNWSIAKTINYGIENSIGEFITFLDSDDEYHPTKVEKQLNKILTLPKDYGMVYCWMTYFDQKSMKIIKEHKPTVKGDVSVDVVAEPVVSGTPTYFFRRDAFIENGGWKEKDEIGIVSDWELAARFCQKWKVDFVPESLINVYVNHGVVRMSEKSYYKDFWIRNIQFHEYMLRTFRDVFEEIPSKAHFHLYMLVRSYCMIGQLRKAFSLYLKLLKSKPTSKNVLSLFYSIYLRIKYGTKD